MKQKFRKTIALILSTLMVLTAFAGTSALPVFAADTTALEAAVANANALTAADYVDFSGVTAAVNAAADTAGKTQAEIDDLEDALRVAIAKLELVTKFTPVTITSSSSWWSGNVAAVIGDISVDGAVDGISLEEPNWRQYQHDSYNYMGTSQTVGDNIRADYYFDRSAVNNLSTLGDFISFHAQTTGKAHVHHLLVDIVYETPTMTQEVGISTGTNKVTAVSDKGVQLEYTLTSGGNLLTATVTADVIRDWTSGINGALPDAGDTVAFRVIGHPGANNLQGSFSIWTSPYITLYLHSYDPTNLRDAMAFEVAPKSNYTADSYAAYRAALDNASEVLNKADPSQNEIDAAATILNNAINSLKTTVTVNGNGGEVSPTTLEVVMGRNTSVPFPADAVTVSPRSGYSFEGWDKANVTFNDTVTAQWTQIGYNVTAAAGEGTTISNVAGLYPAGTELEFTVTVKAKYNKSAPVVKVNGATLANPTPEGDVYTYSITVEGPTAIVTEDLEENTYTIKFMAWNADPATDAPLQTVSVAHGVLPVYTGLTPQREATAAATYTFDGWVDGEGGYITAATADAVYYAHFAETAKLYTVYFHNAENQVIETVEVPYGGAAALPETAPTKENDGRFDYEFVEWSGNYSNVVKNTYCYPVFRPITNETLYTVSFVADGEELYKTYVTAGESVSYPATAELPTKDGYTFKGWDRVADNVQADTTVYALFANPDEVIVTFVNYDDTFLANYIITKGTDAAYDGETPTRPADGETIYLFIGWDSALEDIQEDTVFTAQFDAASTHVHDYSILKKDETNHWYECACGETDPDSVAAHTPGAAEESVITSATCVTDGSKNVVVRCSVCARTLSESVETVPATGEHSFTNYVYHNDATCLANGTETATCDNCAATDTREAEGTQLDHVFSADDANWEIITDATCITYGAKKTLCTLCGVATQTATIDPTGVHSFVMVRTVAATCVSAGYDEYICSVCGLTEQRNQTEIDAANHAKEPILVGAREATETEDGYSGDLICPACGATIAEGHVEPKTAVPHEHDFATLVSHAEATCAAKAYDVYACACGETQKIETGEVDPDNHAAAPMTVGKREATTESYGYTGDVICPACDKVLSVGEVVEKLVTPHVHSFDTVIEEGEATCIAKAYTVKQCACGETERTETGDLNADNHAGNLILVGAREATATMGGYTGDTICTACGETVETGVFTDPIDPSHTHDYTEIVETGEATCIAKAYAIYQCACGDTKKVETGAIDPENHAGEIKTLGAREATATVDGYTGDKYCLACGNLVEEGSVIPHTGSDAPDTPVNPDTPDDGGSSDTRISIWDWLINFIKKILSMFNIGSGNSPC